MPAAPGPSARLLAHELRGWRARRRIVTGRAALTLGCGQSRISRIEHAAGRLSEDELRRLLGLYQVPPGEQDRLQQLRRDALREARDDCQDQDLAVEVLAWSPDAVPLPLRTEAYARAVLASVRRVRQTAPSGVKAEITASRDWQARLAGDVEDAPPLALTCVLDEAVLARRRGATSAMAGQLDYLAAVAGLPGAAVRVLPLAADGPAFGPFTLIGYGDELADVVLVDGPAGAGRVAGDDKAAMSYRFAFEDLLAAAADPGESAALIKSAANRWA